MNGNGVAKAFWSEILDVRTPADDDRGDRREVRRKKRLLLVRRSGR